MSIDKIILMVVKHRGLNYKFTNVNYDLTIASLSNNYPNISVGDIFTKVNMSISPLIQDSGTEDNPITITVDAVEPFTNLSKIEKPMEIEVYELNGTYINPKFKGEVTKFIQSSQYRLTVSTIKSRFKYSIPVLTVGPTCPFVPYSEQCRVNKRNYRKLIKNIDIVDRTVYFNIDDIVAWYTRQNVLDSNSLGLAFTNGFIEQNGTYFTIEEHKYNEYDFTTTATNIVTINETTTDFILNQKVQLLPTNEYLTITSISTTTTSVTLTLSAAYSTTNSSIAVNLFMVRDEIDIEGRFWATEGDNRSYEHCRLKFNNESRFAGFINPPDRNPVTSATKQVN